MSSARTWLDVIWPSPHGGGRRLAEWTRTDLEGFMGRVRRPCGVLCEAVRQMDPADTLADHSDVLYAFVTVATDPQPPDVLYVTPRPPRRPPPLGHREGSWVTYTSAADYILDRAAHTKETR